MKNKYFELDFIDYLYEGVALILLIATIIYTITTITPNLLIVKSFLDRFFSIMYKYIRQASKRKGCHPFSYSAICNSYY